MEGQILNTARATVGRVGTWSTRTAPGRVASIATGCAAREPEATMRTVVDGAAVLEPPSLTQQAPLIEGPSEAQQSSAAVWAQVRQGHSAKTRLNTIMAKRPRRSRRSAEVTGLCITPGPDVARMQLNHPT